MACSWDLPENLQRAEKLIREAAALRAQARAKPATSLIHEPLPEINNAYRIQ
jgi:hypothetical protein